MPPQSLQGFAPPPLPAPIPAATRPAALLASAPAVLLPARLGWSRWLSGLLFGLLLLLLLMITSWLLRACAPVDPSLNVATLETPAPPAPEPPPDPTPLLKASLDDAQADEKKLKLELAALEQDLKGKEAMCKPPEPKVAAAPPPPPVAKPAPPPPPPPPQVANAPPANRPPPGMLPCDWSGNSGGEGVTRHKHYLGEQAGLRRHQLRPVCQTRRHQGDLSRPDAGRNRRPAQRPRRLRLRLESGGRGLFGRCHRNR